MLFDMFNEFLNTLIVKFMDSLFINSLDAFTKYLKLNEDIFVGSMTTFVSTLAIALLIFMATKQGISIYITRTDGDADQNPLEFVVRIFTATATIAANSFIYKMLYDISIATTRDVMKQINYGNLEQNIMQSGQNLSDDGAGGIFSYNIIVGILGIAFIIFTIRASIRAVEICIMHLLLPIFALDLITTNRERWNTFITGYITTFISWCFQLVCVGGLVVAISHGEQSLIWAFGWIVMCIKAPKFLEKYTYTSGVGRAVGNGARSAAMMAPSIIRGMVR